MEQNSQLQDREQKNSTSKIALIALLIIVSAVAIGYGGYYLGSAMNKPRENNAAVDNDYHTAVSVGYPWNNNKKVVTELAVPNRLQAVVAGASINDSGYANFLTNKFNDEMGRWLLDDPADATDRPGKISLVHISNDWLQETNEMENVPYKGPLRDYEFTTPDQKRESLSALETETTECVKDDAKGFVISEKINVCYEPSFNRQAVGSYDPVMHIRGYGALDGEEYVFVGSVPLSDGTKHNPEEANRMADAFQAGDIPQETRDVISEYINALKNTTISSEQRN